MLAKALDQSIWKSIDTQSSGASPPPAVNSGGSGGLRIEVEDAHTRQQIRFGQIRMLMPAEGAIHQPVAILNIEGKAADEALLIVVWGDEVQAILVFSVKHDVFHVGFEARMVVHPHDEAVTQDSHRSIDALFVVKVRRRRYVSVKSAPRSSRLAPATPIKFEGL